ncbi:hypothetical protein CTAYLR_009555 [Chrysophaeum taylorii]|uniref:ferredoxin--NADP(+) reductase n=1 Tax=Chrysophaeum taylorii TaxID=2483200 RepID=A0AAD7UK03_9STRA|nr:hypothetical protein CTAYLR_009555 [Chrysophaeum taylorii]
MKVFIVVAGVCSSSSSSAFVLGPPRRLGSRVAATREEALQELIVKEHELTLRSVKDARAEALEQFAPRIAELQAAIEAKKNKAPDVVPAPSQELHFLEYAELPMNAVGKKDPLAGTVRSVTRAIGADAPGDICHVVIHTRGKLPYVEGQSVGVLPPGLDAKGRPHQPRLYSIASTRYGDDGAGTSVSLCVRRAVYVDPATKIEDPSKKGVCSNFLCDSTPGAEVKLTGPTGKGMLLPEDDAADIIMVATGTGIAPFRGFVQRLFVERTPAAARFRGRAWLFLGVPTTSSVLYADLWELAKHNRPFRFDASFAISREETNSEGEKMYVQHRIEEHADELFKRLENGAHVYFCGLKGMMPGIEATFEKVCAERGLDYAPWLKALKKEKRWHVEVY